MKTYRFFYHYNKPNNRITVHWRGKCYIVKKFECNVPSEAKFNKAQPRFVMQGFARNFKHTKDKVVIS